MGDKNSCFNVLCRRNERTFMKLIVDVATDKVLGAAIVGPDDEETIQVCLHYRCI